MSRKKTLLGVDILRHALIIGVILIHIRSRTRYSSATLSKLDGLVFLVQGVVALFFLLSGYFFRLAPGQGVVRTVISTILLYAKRLLVPFVLFSILYSIADHFLTRSATPSQDLAMILKGVGVGMQMYFLSCLFVFECCITLVAALSRSRMTLQLILLALLAAGALLWAMQEPTAAITGPNLRLIPFYAAAFLTGTLLANPIAARRQAFLGIAAAAILIPFALGWHDFRFFFLAANAVLFMLAWLGSKFLPERRLPGSGGVYLLHAPILVYAVSIGLTDVGIMQWPNVLLGVACTYLLCLGLTLGFSRAFPDWRWLILE